MLLRPTSTSTTVQTVTAILYRESFVEKHPGFQAAEVETWTKLTGDSNPIHTSSTAAKEAGAV